MPPLEQMDRHQDALLWEVQGSDRYGEPKVAAAPVELTVRWEHGRAEMFYQQQNTENIDATVIVDRDVAVGSVMWLGSLEEWAGTGSGVESANLMRVTRVRRATDLKGRYTRYELNLQRLKGSLPEQI